MNITGALLGFAIASIIAGVIGSIVSGALLGDADPWDNTTKFKKSLAFFTVLFFTGVIMVGGLS